MRVWPTQEIIDILKQKSRDNSRTPVQWNSSEHAGFTTGTPWIHTAANYQEINAEKALQGLRFHLLSLSKTDSITERI